METIRFVLRRRVGEAKLLLGQQLVHLNPTPGDSAADCPRSLVQFNIARRNAKMEKTARAQSTHDRDRDCLAHIGKENYRHLLIIIDKKMKKQ